MYSNNINSNINSFGNRFDDFIDTLLLNLNDKELMCIIVKNKWLFSIFCENKK